MTFKHLFSSFALIGFLCASTSGAEPSQLLKRSQQILVVITADWNVVPGELTRFEWNAARSQWKKIGATIPIVVGRNGLGWGKGLHPTNDLVGPIKKEGDGKSPAGIFNLSAAFGREPLPRVNFIKLPYQELLSPIECVDDVKSTHYNRIVNRGQVEKVDWDSSEKMREVGEQYRLGVIVDHNTDSPMAGGGSCIFMHIWKNEQTGTSGCTAMQGKNMEELLHWLDPRKHPLLIQLPESEYKKEANSWNLPR